MSDTVRLTMAQALVRYLAALRVDGRRRAASCSAACSRSSVTATSPASAKRCTRTATQLPTYRAHNEQAMAHAAIAYRQGEHAPAHDGVHDVDRAGRDQPRDRPQRSRTSTGCRCCCCRATSSSSRAPDPVLQQVEDFHDGTVSANDCFRPVSRYFDRIMHPAQLLTALPRAVHVLTDPALCGPVTLALAAGRAGDGVRLSRRPSSRRHGPSSTRRRRSRSELARSRRRCCATRQRPLIIAGGGVLYAKRSGRAARVRRRARRSGRRNAGRQGRAAVGPSAAARRRSASPARPRRTRSRAMPMWCSRVGTRLQDFTTGSHSMFARARDCVSINVNAFDALKWRGVELRGRRARRRSPRCRRRSPDWRATPAWTTRAHGRRRTHWRDDVDADHRRARRRHCRTTAK